MLLVSLVLLDYLCFSFVRYLLRHESCGRFFFFSSRRRHTRLQGDWSSDVCSSDLDLNATGADMTFVSERAYWLNGTPIPHTFSNVGGVLTFGSFPVVPAGQQFVIEVTVVLNDTPTNVPGKQFVNTAKWQFGRLIGGTFYEPLPGQSGVTPPMTIAAPMLVVTKSGPATMNLGQWGNFSIDVQNTGLSDAWNVSLRDLLPHGATGGMCDQTPEILDRKSTRLNSSHLVISYAVFCLKKKKKRRDEI